MPDVMIDNVEIYVRELILKELGSSSDEEKVLWDHRKQMETIWATKIKEIKGGEKNRKLERPI